MDLLTALVISHDLKTSKTNKPRNICGGPLMSPVDVKNSGLMIKLGLHPKPVRIDTKVFEKTEQEKLVLKRTKYKKEFPSFITCKYAKDKLGKLSIHLRQRVRDKMFVNTHTATCKESDIASIISMYRKNHDLVQAWFRGKRLQVN